MGFPPVQVVVRRGMHPDGRIGSRQCGRVVADDDHGLLFWIEAGSATMRRMSLDGQPTRPLPIRTELTMPTVLTPATWSDFRTLMLMPTSVAHSIWWSWTP